jgi:hypothetical protein
MNVNFNMANTMAHVAAMRVVIPELPLSLSEKLKSFADLEEGWDYGAGGPVPEHRIRAAQTWNRILELFGFSKLDASPGSDGEISIAGSCGDRYLEIVVESDDVSASVAYDFKGEQQFYVRRPVIEALDLVLDVAGEIWSASTWYTPESIMQARGSGFVQPFGTTRGLFPSFPASVFRDQDVQLATMQEYITEHSRAYAANLLFFGNLTPTNYPPVREYLWTGRRSTATTSWKA